jgi:hypothetical protein
MAGRYAAKGRQIKASLVAEQNQNEAEERKKAESVGSKCATGHVQYPPSNSKNVYSFIAS